MSSLQAAAAEANISPLSNTPIKQARETQSDHQSNPTHLDEAMLSLLYHQPPPLSNAPIDPELASLQPLDASMLSCIEQLAQAISLLNDVEPHPDQLTSTIDSLIQSIGAIDHHARLTNVQVPLSLIDAIECGSNPEQLVAQTLERASTVNDAMRGKMQATEALKQSLELLSQQMDQTQLHDVTNNQSVDSVDEQSKNQSTDPTSNQSFDQLIDPTAELPPIAELDPPTAAMNDQSLSDLELLDQSELPPPIMMDDDEEEHIDII